MKPSSENWSVENNKASLVGASFDANVPLDCPGTGFQITKVADKQIATNSLLGYRHLPERKRTIVDQYVRAEDVVGTYIIDSPVPGSYQFRDQVYWRYFQIANNPFSEGVEVLASLQTDLLDLSPRVQLCTSLPPGELFVAQQDDSGLKLEPIKSSQDFDHAVTLALKSAAGWCYLQSLHETDCNSCEKTVIEISDQGIQIALHLFFDHIEKGVIRRMRIRSGVSATTELQPESIAAWIKDFSDSELPLTV